MTNRPVQQSGHELSGPVTGLVGVVIVVNTGLLVWSALGHNEWADRLETLCVAFFVGEIIWRLRLYHWHPLVFVRQRWNAFDTVVIVLALTPGLGVGVTLLRVARLARIVHLGRHITALRLVRLVTRHHDEVTA
jgi:hypothetical protein